MQQRFLYLALILMLFASCEDYYTPDLEQVPGRIVVESCITNDPGHNYVKLSVARDYYSTDAIEWIVFARVELTEVGGPTFLATLGLPGTYHFENTPEEGKAYILRIFYQKEVYESDPVHMPPLPQIDSLYTAHKLESVYLTNAYGVPQEFIKPVREIKIDASTSQVNNFRFNCREVLQWMVIPPPPDGPGPTDPIIYGWMTISSNELFNIAGAKPFSYSTQVRNHPLFTLSYNTQKYLNAVERLPMGWILIIDQYGTSRESYDYHEKMNQQFEAKGNLFDPLATQIYGNMHCTSDKSKIALGFFDLNSYRQHRYFLEMGPGENNHVTQRRLNTYPEIPDYGDTIVIPDFWEYR